MYIDARSRSGLAYTERKSCRFDNISILNYFS